jgi:hypothetical protein
VEEDGGLYGSRWFGGSLFKTRFMEKILRIKSGEFEVEGHYSKYDGFIIETNTQIIKVGISSEQHCCESYGCLMTNDTTQDFVGAELIGISRTDQVLNDIKIDELEYLDEGGAMFVNLKTSVGLLQFVAYNAHNGYYGHGAVLISKQLNLEESL